MHERDLPDPGRRPFDNASKNQLENMLHDAYVAKFVNGTLTSHYWKQAERQGWDSSPGSKLSPPEAAKESLRKMAYHNHLTLTAEQHSNKIFNHLRLHHGASNDSWSRIRDIAKESAAEQLDSEHGLKLDSFYH